MVAQAIRYRNLMIFEYMEDAKYIEWLTTISNTRLIYNTMEELEKMLDNNSIHSNGILRSLPTLQRQRSAFRDLKEEVSIMTKGIINLERLLIDYQEAWAFYQKHLARRSDPEKIVQELINFAFPPYQEEELAPNKKSIYEMALSKGIDISILILLLLKVLPGCHSKSGDVTDMPLLYGKVLKQLEIVTQGKTIFQTIPAIIQAREEEYKSRITLLYHLKRILDTYESYGEEANIYGEADDFKRSSVTLDINGYWNECGGEANDTQYWSIEAASNAGVYFATHWRKDAGKQLVCIQYTLALFEDINHRLVAYMLHPESILHHMQGLPYGDSDHVWYVADMPETNCPDQLFLERLMSSTSWDAQIHLTRCRKREVIECYKKWEKHCEIVSPFAHLEYSFQTSIYAITQEHLYIASRNEGEYYKVPRDAFDGLEQITLNDVVGIMEMNGATYLAFDELMIYIPATKKELERYGIEISRTIE